MKRFTTTLAGLILMAVLVTATQADVTIETVPVGNLGNAADMRYNLDQRPEGYGSVSYAYNIGKYEVTAGQYCKFLNAVAASDPYGLYNAFMANSPIGCRISRLGVSGNHRYIFNTHFGGTGAGLAERPVNFVSWADAARFANWLHNGQGNGDTEHGVYDLSGTHLFYNPDGSVTDSSGLNAALMTVERKGDWKWAIANEDEWYKAAYHDKNAGVAATYYDYTTSSDTAPGYVNDSGNLSGSGTAFTDDGIDPGNYATHDGDGGTFGIGSPYYRTKVGEWENSGSPYGTFDQGGNVFEWNETNISDSDRGFRGGACGYHHGATYQLAASRLYTPPASDGLSFGFRVVQVPEPGTITLLLFGLASLTCWRRRM